MFTASQVHPLHWFAAPHVAPSRPTPPGRKRSKGNRALAGAWGVFFVFRHPSHVPRRVWAAQQLITILQIVLRFVE